MELFARLFESVLLFMYHCFDRVVIHGYLSGLSRPEQAVYFFRDVIGEAMISKEVLSRRTQQYQAWVEAYARNHKIPIEWAEKGVRKEDYLRPELRQMERRNDHGVYFILKSMEQGNTFRSSAAPLARDGDPLSVEIGETDTSFTVAWKGQYQIDGAAFVYAEKGSGRLRTILGYPTRRIVQQS